MIWAAKLEAGIAYDGPVERLVHGVSEHVRHETQQALSDGHFLSLGVAAPL